MQMPINLLQRYSEGAKSFRVGRKILVSGEVHTGHAASFKLAVSSTTNHNPTNG